VGFKPAYFTVVLATKDGKFITAESGADFNFSIELPSNENNQVLEPGKYVFMVDANWNETNLTDSA
jgi:hypothetical protein